MATGVKAQSNVTALPEPDVFDIPFKDASTTINGVEWKFRELSVIENDQCADGAKGPDGEFDGRTMMRLLIIKSSVEPKLDATRLGKLPQRVYLQIARVVNDLNNSEEDEDPGKD